MIFQVVNLTHTIAVPELLWTVLGLFAFYYAALVLHRSRCRLEEIRALGINSDREYAVMTTVLFYALITFSQFMFVIVGILAMSIPPAAENTPVSTFQWITSVAFIANEAVMTAALYINETRRDRVEKRVTQRRAG